MSAPRDGGSCVQYPPIPQSIIVHDSNAHYARVSNATRRDARPTRHPQMNEELTYAEKLLSYMRRCCCCWLCDSCTGADPEEQRKRAWQRRVAK